MYFPQAIVLALSLAQSILTVRTDLECKLNVDGKEQGVVKPGTDFRVSLPPGEHQLEAVPVTGPGRWLDTVELKESEPRTQNIPLQTISLREEIRNRGYWIDRKNQRTWAAADNGSAISLSQAINYCRALTLGGHRDWTLPSIDELQQIFGGTADDRGYRLVSPLNLTGWAWSSTEGKEPGEGWALDFGDGARASVVAGDSGLNRALCVRPSAN